MYKLLLLICLLLNISLCYSQQLFQDASGKSNLFLGNSPYGWITFNSSDKSGSIGYTRNRDIGFDHTGKHNYNYIYGGDLKISVKNGLGSLVSGGSLKPGISASGNFGIFTNEFFHGSYASIYVTPNVSYTQYAFVDSTLSATPRVNKINKTEGGSLINFNFQFNRSKRTKGPGDTKIIDTLKTHYFFFGVQTGYNITNNYADLDEVTVNTLVFGTANPSAYKTETGKLGSYQRYGVMPLNIDFGVTPRLFGHNYFGFNTYFRSNFFKPKNVSNVGVGIYLADEKKPSNISGGFAWQFNDITDNLKKPGSTFEKSSIFFYVGYTICK